MALRHRSRHLRATIYNKVIADLTTLGWISAPVNFGTTAVTVVDYQPDERNEPVRTNTVAVSLGDVVNDTDEELGAASGGLRSAHYPVFIDVYMAEQALADAICDDLRDIFDNAIFALVDQVSGADSVERIEIDEVMGPDRPTGANSADPFKRFWRVMRIGVRLYYQSGGAAPVVHSAASTVGTVATATGTATRAATTSSSLASNLAIAAAATRASAGAGATIPVVATVAPSARRATSAAVTATAAAATITATATVATSGPVFDASTPAMASSSYQGTGASQAYTSNAFSPPGQSLIVAVLSATQSYIVPWNTPTVTDSLGTPLTWHVAAGQADVSTYTNGSSGVWVAWAYCPSAQTNMTVTATYSLSTPDQVVTSSTVAPYVFTNPDMTTAIGTTVTGVSDGSAVAANITPSGSSSALLLAAVDSGAAQTALTAGAGTYLASEFHGLYPSYAVAWYGTSAGPTLTGSAQTLNLTGANTSRTQWVALEVRGGSGIGPQSYMADGNVSVSASVSSVAILAVPTVTGGGAVTASVTKRAAGSLTLTGGGSSSQPAFSAPTGTRFSTGLDLSYLQGPSSAPAGAVVVNPGGATGTTIDALTTSHPAGTTFWLAPGRHRLGTPGSPSPFDQIQAKAGNTYIGAPGAYIDGQGVNRYTTTGNASGVTFSTLRVTGFVAPFDEFCLNHDTADNFTVYGCEIDHNNGAGLGLGSGNVVTYSWLHDNQQYGFSAFNPGVDGAHAVQYVTVDHCEISGNGDINDEIDPISGNYTGNGRNGGGKFWDTYGITVTNCWVHNNNWVGLWADTNNAVALFADNLIEYNAAEGIIYEISFNFMITRNVIRGNDYTRGVRDRGDTFPRPGVYISESGGSSAISSTYATSEISYNYFIDNWDVLAIFENADRFYNSPANTSGQFYAPPGATLAKCNNPSVKTLTCTTTSGSTTVTVTSGLVESTDMGRPVSGAGIPVGAHIVGPTAANGFAEGYVDGSHFILTAPATATASGVTLTLAAGSIAGADYDVCRWESTNIDVHHNTISHNSTRASNGANMTGARNGRIAVVSNYGTYPAWSPYTGTAISSVIATSRNNHFHDNAYHGPISWEARDTGSYLTSTQWRAVPQDTSGSTFDPAEPA